MANYPRATNRTEDGKRLRMFRFYVIARSSVLQLCYSPSLSVKKAWHNVSLYTLRNGTLSGEVEEVSVHLSRQV